MKLTVSNLSKQICEINSFPTGTRIVFIDLNGDRIGGNKIVVLQTDVPLASNSHRLWFYASEVIEIIEAEQQGYISEAHFILDQKVLDNWTVRAIRSMRTKNLYGVGRIVLNEMWNKRLEFGEQIDKLLSPTFDECEDNSLPIDPRLDIKFALLKSMLDIIAVEFDRQLFLDALLVDWRIKQYFSSDEG